MRILFLCTANSCRSQMAEAWGRHLYPDDWKVCSAGLLIYRITDRTRRVMAEVGLDMEGQKPKTFDVFDLNSFDKVVTLSEEAGRYLPALRDPARHVKRPIADPMAASGSSEEIAAAFRTGRDTIRDIVASLLPSDFQPEDA